MNLNIVYMKKSLIIRLSFVLLLFSSTLIFCCGKVNGQNTNYAPFSVVKSDELLASVRSSNLEKIEQTSAAYDAERYRLIQELINILTSTNDPDSSLLDKAAAAHYLGLLHASQATDALAANIGLVPDVTQIDISHLPKIINYPAKQALIEIGNSSIPSLIQNLAHQDDVKVRGLSLEALCQIDRDKDVVELRLKKAMETEHDPQKNKRLSEAVKLLITLPVEKSLHK